MIKGTILMFVWFAPIPDGWVQVDKEKCEIAYNFRTATLYQCIEKI